ncbi:MAG: hypothetical protein M5T61_05165 [Acidimicrobiia bacterium]|nr:hypothetical protein [Acidimicrobiia bacterium]
MTRFGQARLVDNDTLGQEGDLLHFVAEVAALEELRTRLDTVEAHR